MDLTALAAIVVAASGAVGAIVAIFKAPKDRESLAVKTQKDVIADMRDLVDELVEALERCRVRSKELEAERRAIEDAHQRETVAHRRERERIVAEAARLEVQLREARKRLGDRP
jgi:hypothetical protein